MNFADETQSMSVVNDRCVTFGWRLEMALVARARRRHGAADAQRRAKGTA